MTKKQKRLYLERVNKKLAVIYMHMLCENDKAVTNA